MTTIGPWVLLIGGVGLLATSIKLAFADDRLRQMILMIVFGTLLSGTSVWGLSFMPKLADFLDATGIISAMLGDPSSATYGAAMDLVASGELEPELAEAALAIALQYPVEDLGEIMDESAEKASSLDGRLRIQAARTTLDQSQKTAEAVAQELLERGPGAGSALESLDPRTRILVSRHLMELSDARLQQSDLDRRRLAEFGQVRPRMRPAPR